MVRKKAIQLGEQYGLVGVWVESHQGHLGVSEGPRQVVEVALQASAHTRDLFQRKENVPPLHLPPFPPCPPEDQV